MRRRDYDTIGESCLTPAVVCENRMGNDRGWVYSSPCAIMTSTPFAASTSRALASAGTERACVSMPRNSGPSIFCCFRYRQIA